MDAIRHMFAPPRVHYIIAALLAAGLIDHYLITESAWLLWSTALIGSIIPFREALEGAMKKTITIEAFNFMALVVSFATGEVTSASFIGLMLTFASYLDWRTESRAGNAVEELLKLKPHKANRLVGETTEEIASDDVRVGDVLVVKNGERIPVDGVIIYGEALINESSLTGESVPVEKDVGDEVYSGTLSETGVIKLRATKIGADSTLERMARLVEEAGKQKSKAQRLADRFAGIFLPVVVLAGIATYLISKSITMTAAFFLVVCADDIAVSIPLAVTASLGYAAKRGVIIKGGEWLDTLAKVRILVFDKTGTLTYGDFRLAEVRIQDGIIESDFWRLVGITEKFSEHPVGRAIFKEAKKKCADLHDPDEIFVFKGAGLRALIGNREVVIGNEKVLPHAGLSLSANVTAEYNTLRASGYTGMLVFIDKSYAGMLAIADTPREEAKTSILKLRDLGVRVVMITGDNEVVAKEVCSKLGITEFRAGVTPEGKLNEIAELSKSGMLAMVGDGVNDAPALARANVGIAMGAGGTAVAVESANIVILTDNLARIPEMITLARRTVSVVNLNMGIWFVTNAIGVGLVFGGILGPVLAAAYNFATDFLPLLNSVRLFRNRKA